MCKKDAGDEVPKVDVSIKNLFGYVPIFKWEECLYGGACDRCEGDCDSDDQCKDDLVCQQRDRNDGVGRGCSGSIPNDDGYDFCVLREKRRRVSCSMDGVIPGDTEEKALPVLKNVDGVSQIPASVAVSMRGTIVIGYSDFVLDYKVPSSAPSSLPSLAPSISPPDPLSTQGSSQGMSSYPPEIDGKYRGSIVVFTMNETDEDFKPYNGNGINVKVKKLKRLKWDEENYETNQNGHLLGEFDIGIEDGFGSAVAISADNSTIVIGCPSYSREEGEAIGRVKVLRASSNSNWGPLGSDDGYFENVDDLIQGFGKLLALSDNGSILAVGANNTLLRKDVILVFQLNGNNWEAIGENVVEVDVGITIESLKISTMEKRIIVSAVRSTGEEDSYEVSSAQNKTLIPDQTITHSRHICILNS